MERSAPKQHFAPKHWDPDHYLKYADQRMRPALDLLARVPLTGATRITDLGCGPGNVTPHLSRRFPGAELQGVDSSAEMLSTAHTTHGDLSRWVQGDANDWCPDAAQDLIYSNAALQWVDDHATLFPRLMGLVVPGGVLAVQMPNQFNEPSHVLMREVAANGPWAKALAPLLRPAPVAKLARYYDWLAPYTESIDIWETVYMQVMHGDDPVLDWISSTALKSLLEALSHDQAATFKDALAERLRAAYPKRKDATTLFAFKRLFLVAVRAPV